MPCCFWFRYFNHFFSLSFSLHLLDPHFPETDAPYFHASTQKKRLSSFYFQFDLLISWNEFKSLHYHVNRLKCYKRVASSNCMDVQFTKTRNLHVFIWDFRAFVNWTTIKYQNKQSECFAFQLSDEMVHLAKCVRLVDKLRQCCGEKLQDVWFMVLFTTKSASKQVTFVCVFPKYLIHFRMSSFLLACEEIFIVWWYFSSPKKETL